MVLVWHTTIANNVCICALVMNTCVSSVICSLIGFLKSFCGVAVVIVEVVVVSVGCSSSCSSNITGCSSCCSSVGSGINRVSLVGVISVSVVVFPSN